MAQTALGFGIIVALAGLFAIPMTTAGKGKDLSVPLVPGEKERCPVCGMFVSPYPATQTAKTVMVSAARAMGFRQPALKRCKMAEMSVPEWAIPTQNTKLIK